MTEHIETEEVFETKMAKEESVKETQGPVRVTVGFPKKDIEWMQRQVEEGEYSTLAEVARMCVRTVRTGLPKAPEISLEDSPIIVVGKELAEILQSAGVDLKSLVEQFAKKRK